MDGEPLLAETRQAFRLTMCKSFVSLSIADKYGFEIPPYDGVDQVVEVATTGGKG